MPMSPGSHASQCYQLKVQLITKHPLQSFHMRAVEVPISVPNRQLLNYCKFSLNESPLHSMG